MIALTRRRRPPGANVPSLIRYLRSARLLRKSLIRSCRMVPNKAATAATAAPAVAAVSQFFTPPWSRTAATAAKNRQATKAALTPMIRFRFTQAPVGFAAADSSRPVWHSARNSCPAGLSLGCRSYGGVR